MDIIAWGTNYTTYIHIWYVYIYAYIFGFFWCFESILMGLVNGISHSCPFSQQLVWNENLKPVLIQFPFYGEKSIHQTWCKLMQAPCVPLVMFETSFSLMTCFGWNRGVDSGTFTSDELALSTSGDFRLCDVCLLSVKSFGLEAGDNVQQTMHHWHQPYRACQSGNGNDLWHLQTAWNVELLLHQPAKKRSTQLFWSLTAKFHIITKSQRDSLLFFFSGI